MSANNRSRKRQPVCVDGMIYDRSGKQLASCTLRNISETGAQLELAGETEIPEKFLLSLSRDGQVQRQCKKIWQFSTVTGVRFCDEPRAPKE